MQDRQLLERSGFEHLNFGHLNLFRISDLVFRILVAAFGPRQANPWINKNIMPFYPIV